MRDRFDTGFLFAKPSSKLCNDDLIAPMLDLLIKSYI